MKQNLLLFDIDGTLLSGMDIHIQAFEHAFRVVHNTEIQINKYGIQGSTDRIIVNYFAASHGIANARVEECFAVMSEYFQSSLGLADIKILPGVKKLLDVLSQHKNIILGHVTGNVKNVALAKMRHVGLGDVFILGGYGCMPHSERPELVNYAIREAQERFDFCSLGDNVILFDDTPRGINAGKKAGVITIAVPTGKYSADQLNQQQPDAIIPDFETGKKVVLKLVGL